MIANIIEINNLVVCYNSKPVNKPINITISSGEIGILYGANGSGKTSIIRVLSGELKTYAGEVTVLGMTPQDWGVARMVQNGVRIIPQFSLIPKFLSVKQYLNVWKKNLQDYKGIENSVIKEMRSFLKGLGIEEDKIIGELSYGQCRIIDACCTINAKPSVILADEPLAGLAQSVSNIIQKMIKDFCHPGTAALITAHNFDQVIWEGLKQYDIQSYI